MHDNALPLRAAEAAAPKPAPDPSPGSERERRAPAPSEPGPDQAPHEHGDDAGVHPDGPRRYHDDHATPARMRARDLRTARVEEEEGLAA